MSETKWLCPCKIFLGKPMEFASLPRVNCQTMIVLSVEESLRNARQSQVYVHVPRDAVRIISGFSELVAIAVTHPP